MQLKNLSFNLRIAIKLIRYIIKTTLQGRGIREPLETLLKELKDYKRN